MKIAELKPGMNVDLSGKIVDMEDPKEVTTKFGSRTTLTVVTVEDDTGKIKLTLWGIQSDGIVEGENVEIKNAFVKSFRDELQLTLGKNGSIKMV